MAKENYRTPTIDRATALPDLGTERFSGERFHSAEFMHSEWQQLWRRTWNMTDSVVIKPGN